MNFNNSVSVKLFLVCLFIVISSRPASAQGFAWAHGIISPNGVGMPGVIASVTDASNNGLFVGAFNGTVDFDPGPGVQNLTAIGNLNMFILKKDAAGNFLWVKHISGISPNMYGCYGRNISVDSFGNIYVAGYYRDSFDFDPGPAIYKLSSLGGYHSFVLKLSPSGDFVWVRDMGSQTTVGIIQLACMSMDAASNIYFACSIGGTATPVTVDVDPGSGVYNILCPAAGAGSQDILIEKLDSAGNFVWARQISGTMDKDPWSLAIDTFSNVYIAGQFEGIADFDPGPSTANLISAGSYDIFIAKYDSAGNYQWAKRIGGIWDDVGHGVATDTFGNVVVTGYFGMGTVDFDPGFGVFNMTASSSDMFVLKLRNDGSFAWANSIHVGGNDAGRAITTDGQGNVYTAGMCSGGADFDPGPQVYVALGDVYVQKLDSSGNFLWARAWGGDIIGSINLDHSNDIYITGSFSISGDFDPGPGVFTLIGFNDGFILKLCGASLDIAANDSSICAGTSAQLFTPAISGATYVWTKDGAIITGSGNTITVTQDGAFEVYVNGACPSASGPVYISVIPTLQPTISISGPQGATVGQQVTINANVANAGPAYSIEWKNKGISFATTTVPSVTYIKQAGSDSITAFITSTSPGCYDSTLSNTHRVYDATGITETMKAAGIEIYPNPFEDAITVKGLEEQDRLSLVDLSGRVIQQWYAYESAQTLMCSELSAGYYLLRITNSSGVVRINVPVVKR